MSDSKPLAVWDTREQNSLWWRHYREASPWAQEHIADADSTYRAEFYLIDVPFVVLYRYERGEDGRVRTDPATNEPVAAKPVKQTLDELPPAHLLAPA
jgi:hypothetical protein